ncbi:MAG: hypothetical protein RIK87_29295 [Fuerstiella sp.]
MSDRSLCEKLQTVCHACDLLADRYGMIADVLINARTDFVRILEDDQGVEALESCREELTRLTSDLTAEGDVETMVHDLDGFETTKVFDRIMLLKNDMLAAAD